MCSYYRVQGLPIYFWWACTLAGKHEEVAFSDLSIAVGTISSNVNTMPCLKSLNPPSLAHNLTKAVHECPDYRVSLVWFRYCWDWRTCTLYGIWGVRISEVLIVHKYM